VDPSVINQARALQSVMRTKSPQVNVEAQRGSDHHLTDYLLLDFLPRDPTSPLVAAALLTGQAVPGMW
jgi:hypothetical protein